jgi:alpha-glucosidase/alpha-D-xyloside xylohydrolase
MRARRDKRGVIKSILHAGCRKTPEDSRTRKGWRVVPRSFPSARFWSVAVLARFLLACVVSFRTQAAEPLHFAGESAELTIGEVSERTIRIEVAPLDERGHPKPEEFSSALVSIPTKEKVRIRELTGKKEIKMGKIRVLVEPTPLRISLYRSDDSLVQELSFDEGTNAAVSFRTDAPVLGLGEGEQQFDRRGKLYPMINGQLSPMLATHGATIPVPFLIGTDGWAMFIEAPWGKFDLREGKGRFLSGGKAPLVIFLTAYSEAAEVMAEFIRITGKPVMPPKWSLGYIQSHRTLSGPDEPLQIAKTFREKKLPCDALIYLGTGYCTNGWNTGHGSLEFNPNGFNHPAEQIQALHDLNFKVIFHINHAPRNMFGLSMAENSDSPLHIKNYWARHRADFSLGVDGWWPDDGDELPIEARLARHRCYYEGPLLERTNSRPWSLHRNGYAGVARYGGWIWSGDTMSRWATLAAHVPVGLNYSLSVSPFWGTDTGGFVATREFTGELYARWFQFSAFNPLFRSHGRTWHLRLPWGWNTGDYGPIETPGRPDESELHNAEIEPICRKYLELRYQLLPYNYTLTRESCDTGLPIMRALWFYYPKDPEAVKLGDEYLWGRDILVAPVVEKGAKARRVYLPDGDWYDWWTNEKLSGHRWVERAVDLQTMPLYVRAGAIIPLDPVRQYTSQKVEQPTMIAVYPGTNGTFVMYEDDGASLDYKRDIAAWTRFSWNDRSRTLTIQPDSKTKAKSAGSRNFEVVLASSGERKSVQFSNRAVEVKF